MHRVLRACSLSRALRVLCPSLVRLPGHTSAFILTCLLAVFPTNGATIYCSVSGSGSGSGADENNFKSEAATKAALVSGDTILLGDGTYSTWDLSAHFVTVRAINQWQAKIVGSAGTHAFYGNDNFHSNTIDGVWIQSAYITGVKANGHGWTIRNCRIEGAGRGHPSWATNSSGLYTGNGIEAHDRSGTTIENCLIQNNGAFLTQDHGIYANGTNVVVRNCVIRSNCAWGLQLYNSPGNNDNAIVDNCIITDNGTPGTTQSGLMLYTYGAKTATIRNCYINGDPRGYAVRLVGDTSGSVITIRNCILRSASWADEITETTLTVDVNYCLRSKAGAGDPTGANDVIAADFKLDSEVNGRYWPASDSPARGIAQNSTRAPFTFFGDVSASITDAGPFQYSALLDADDRNVNASCFWLPPPSSFAVLVSGSAHTLSWGESGSALQGVPVFRSTTSGARTLRIADVDSGLLGYADPVGALAPSTTYYYQAALTNKVGRGPWSAEVSARTPDPLPPVTWPGITAIRPMAVSVGVNGLKTKTGVVFR